MNLSKFVPLGKSREPLLLHVLTGRDPLRRYGTYNNRIAMVLLNVP